MKDLIKQILRESTNKKDKAIEIQAPNKLETKEGYITWFLAGSISGDKASPWQKEVVSSLKDESYIFYNPRRKDWNADIKPEEVSKPLQEQIEWELNALEKADYIVMYFDPKTDSPITLLELGLHARSGKLVVICPDGFWRKGNVDVTCEFYKVKQLETLDEFIEMCKNGKLKEFFK